jgi:hypothetical protein
VQPAIVDAFLEIDTHDAERRQRAAPVEARIDVLGPDFPGLLIDLVHEALRNGAAALTAGLAGIIALLLSAAQPG